MENDPLKLSPAVELAYAYEDVFGREGKRSVSQQKVWDDLMETSYYARTTFVQNPRTGEVNINRGLLAEGRRSLILDIMDYLKMAVNPPQPKPKK